MPELKPNQELLGRYNALRASIRPQVEKRVPQVPGQEEVRDKAVTRLTNLHTTHTFREQQKASKDPLTGAATRGALDEYLLRLLEHPRRGQGDVVMMLDVDKFKRINDTKGHTFGDTILTSLVQILNAHVRGVDMVGRYGGDEFVVVMPGMITYEPGWETQCVKRAEDIRSAVERELAPMINFKKPISVSIGMIGIGPGAKSTHKENNAYTLKVLYYELDHSLYAAKHGGRNRVESPILDNIRSREVGRNG